jgi:hypothetical protein
MDPKARMQSANPDSPLTGCRSAHFLARFVDLRDDPRAALAGGFAFLLIPAAFLPDQARREGFGHGRKDLHDAGRQLATRAIEMTAPAPRKAR